MQELLLLFQVVILPPIIYESSLTMIKDIKVFTRIGTIMASSVISIMLSIAAFAVLLLIFQLNSVILFISVIVQLNDYSGTLESPISFSVDNDETISFMSFMALFKNFFLIFILTTIMPDTKSESELAS